MPWVGKTVHGNFRLLRGLEGVKPNEVTLPRSEVAGYRLRLDWKSRAPTPTTFDWQLIWDSIAIAKAHGKAIGVGVAAGIVCPDWLEGKGAVFNTITIKGGTGRMPWPWDAVFLSEWAKFITAFATEFESEPALVYLVMGGFGQNYGCDCVGNVPADIAAFNAAGGTAAWLAAVKTTASRWANAMRTTPIIIQLNPPLPGDGTTQQFIEWAVQKYPGHMGFMFEGWKANSSGNSGFFKSIRDHAATNPGGLQQFGSAASGQFGGTVAAGVANLVNLGPPNYTEDYVEDFTDANKPLWEQAEGILRP